MKAERFVHAGGESFPLQVRQGLVHAGDDPDVSPMGANRHAPVWKEGEGRGAEPYLARFLGREGELVEYVCSFAFGQFSLRGENLGPAKLSSVQKCFGVGQPALGLLVIQVAGEGEQPSIGLAGVPNDLKQPAFLGCGNGEDSPSLIIEVPAHALGFPKGGCCCELGGFAFLQNQGHRHFSDIAIGFPVQFHGGCLEAEKPSAGTIVP